MGDQKYFQLPPPPWEGFPIPRWFIGLARGKKFPPPGPYWLGKHVGEDVEFWHVTPKRSVPEILKEGLIPGKSISYAFRRRQPALGVYLWDDGGMAQDFATLLVEEDGVTEPLSLLRITLPWSWPVMSDPEAFLGSYITFDSIPPERIEVEEVEI